MLIPGPGRIAILLTFGLLLSSAAVGMCADGESLLGSRIRVTTVEGSSLQGQIEGRVVEVAGAHLEVAPPDGTASQIVPLASVRRIEVHHGRKRATRRGFWTGAAVAGVAGGVVGAMYGSYVALDRDSSANPTGSALLGGAAGGAAGGLVGGAVGAGIGALFKQDDWRDAPAPRPRAALTFQPTRHGVKVALSVRF
jgi:hypothetical protein